MNIPKLLPRAKIEKVIGNNKSLFTDRDYSVREGGIWEVTFLSLWRLVQQATPLPLPAPPLPAAPPLDRPPPLLGDLVNTATVPAYFLCTLSGNDRCTSIAILIANASAGQTILEPRPFSNVLILILPPPPRADDLKDITLP